MEQYFIKNFNSVKDILNLSLKLKEEKDTGILTILVNKKCFLLKVVSHLKEKDIFNIRLLPINHSASFIFGDYELQNLKIKPLDNFEVAIVDKNLINIKTDDKDYYYEYICSHLNIKLIESNKIEHEVAMLHNINHDKKGNLFLSTFLKQQMNLDEKIIIK